MIAQLRVRYVLMLLSFAGALVGMTGTEATAEGVVVVNFSDPNLEIVVRNQLGIPAYTPITDTDMENMLYIASSEGSISSIQGLEYGINLRDAWLDHNQISDISPVSELLNLSWLFLGDNQISDISAVSGLTNLQLLVLNGNQISDISAVSGLQNLCGLTLQDNQINDISAVSGLQNLGVLAVQGNQINDISAVSGLLSLFNLGLTDNQISDISPVAGLEHLQQLDLSNNPISDIAAVSGLNHLTNLYLDDCQVETVDLSNSDLSALKGFSIENNPLSSVLLVDATLGQITFNAIMDGGFPSWSYIGIAEVPGILNLDMSHVDFTEISDLSKMYGMVDLEELLLDGATNLDGGQVVALTDELDSLDWLDLNGLWDTFDAAAQTSLNEWDAVEGNTLVVPEPATISMLLALGALVLPWRWWQ